MGSQTKHNTWFSTQTSNTTGQQLHTIQRQHTHEPKEPKIHHKGIQQTVQYNSQNQHHKQENNKENTQTTSNSYTHHTDQVQAAIQQQQEQQLYRARQHQHKTPQTQRRTQRQQNTTSMEIGQHHTCSQTLTMPLK